MALNRAKASDAIAGLAKELGLDLIATAEGILRIAIENMAADIRTVSVKRGRDPRSYALVPFGGAGPLHACYLADWLGMTRIVVPPNPGVTSAYGLLLTDVRIDQVHTDVQREDRMDFAQIATEILALEQQVSARLASEGFTSAGTVLQHFVDLRYGGQAYEIWIALPAIGDDLAARIRAAIDGFHASHKDLYGYSYQGKQLVELVNVGVTGLGLLQRPQIPQIELAGSDASGAVRGRTTVHFPQEQGSVECAIYDRGKLRAGNELAGPAIIEQYDSTTVLNPGWRGRLDHWGTLVLTKEQA